MKNLSLFTLILIAILLPLIASGQKYVGTWYGSVPGASNAPPNIATNGAAAANGTVMQKTGDRLQLTDTLTNLNIGTAVVSVVYGPYTNLAGYFNTQGRFVGTNSLAVTNTIIGGTNQYGADGFQATKSGIMNFYQGTSGVFNFGASGIGSSDGHVVAGDFTGNFITPGFIITNGMSIASGVSNDFTIKGQLILRSSGGGGTAKMSANAANQLLLGTDADGIITSGATWPSSDGGDLGNDAEVKNYDMFIRYSSFATNTKALWVPVTGRGMLVTSNYAIFWVTPFKTNLISDGN